MKTNFLRLFIYLCLLIAGFVYASNMGGALPYLCLFSLLLYFPVSGIFIFISYQSLRVIQGLSSHRVMKDEDQPFEITLENAFFLPINDMKLIPEDELTEFEFYENSDIIYRNGPMISLKPFEKITAKGRVNCRYAGVYDVGILSTVFYDPFGIIGIELPLPTLFEATVIPRITDIANSVLDFENLKNSSRIKSRLIREPIPGNELRPYVMGDPMKNIHWKASAAAGELISRTPEFLDLRKIALILIAQPPASNKNKPEFIKKRDYFLEFAVSCVYYHANKGENIRVVYPRGSIKDVQISTLDEFSKFYDDISRGPFYNRDSGEEYLKEYCEGMASDEQDTIIIIIRESEYRTEGFIEVRNNL